MLHLQISHGHCMRTLTAVLVLQSSCSSVGCCFVHPVIHKVPHLTAVAATSLTPTETIRSSAVAYTVATSAAASAVGFLHHVSGSTVPQATSLMVCHSSTCAGTNCVRSNITVLQQLSSRLLLPSKRCLSALFKAAAGAAAAAHLLNTAGITRLPEQVVRGQIRCLLAARSAQWPIFGDHQLLLLCHKYGS
jgi:hypothetical protein